jgi:2',3'-cyclic-nucleotide 2'-phosphodiesterase (5'-nucleotidase family)
MRLIEDIEVSEALCNINSPERVDLILGGHDHELLRRYSGEKGKYAHNPEYIDCSFKERDGVVRPDGLVPGARGDVRIVKSGTDWSGLSCVKLHMLRESSGKATLRSVTVEQIADMSKVALGPVELAEARARVGKCLQSVNERIDELGAEPLVHSAVSLEGTGSIIRSRESNLGNMLADMVRAYYDVDIGLVNSGSIRCNKLIRATRPPGQGPEEPLTVRDLIEILPFDNAIVVKRVGASALWDALENSFSDAHTDGRFLHYSGLAVVADWTRNEGNRVIEVQYAPDKDGTGTVIRRGDAMEFTVAMVAFIADGFDGYACFKDQETIVSEEGAVTDTQLLLRTLGYSYEQRDSPKDDAVDEDEARFTRARASIAKEMDSFGLPIIAPEIEGRITIRRLPEASLGNM